MQKGILLALLVATGSGIAIGVQATLTNWGGRLIGATRTGLLVYVAGGAAAGILLLAFSKQNLISSDSLKGSTLPIIIASGLLGIVLITGIAYSLPKIGVAAGLAAVIFGQMAIAVISDTLGWSSEAPIPLSLPRIAGLLTLLFGTWLLLPRE